MGSRAAGQVPVRDPADKDRRAGDHHAEGDGSEKDRPLLCHNIIAQRRAHAPLPAAASVDHRVWVVITEDHRKRAAGSGCMMRLVRLFLIAIRAL